MAGGDVTHVLSKRHGFASRLSGNCQSRPGGSTHSSPRSSARLLLLVCGLDRDHRREPDPPGTTGRHEGHGRRVGSLGAPAQPHPVSDPIIIATCPALAATGAYRVTSPATRNYNCVAWAASRTDRWWWPSPFAYWPAGVPNPTSALHSAGRMIFGCACRVSLSNIVGHVEKSPN